MDRVEKLEECFSATRILRPHCSQADVVSSPHPDGIVAAATTADESGQTPACLGVNETLKGRKSWKSSQDERRGEQAGGRAGRGRAGG